MRGPGFLPLVGTRMASTLGPSPRQGLGAASSAPRRAHVTALLCGRFPAPMTSHVRGSKCRHCRPDFRAQCPRGDGLSFPRSWSSGIPETHAHLASQANSSMRAPSREVSLGRLRIRQGGKKKKLSSVFWGSPRLITQLWDLHRPWSLLGWGRNPHDTP